MMLCSYWNNRLRRWIVYQEYDSTVLSSMKIKYIFFPVFPLLNLKFKCYFLQIDFITKLFKFFFFCFGTLRVKLGVIRIPKNESCPHSLVYNFKSQLLKI